MFDESKTIEQAREIILGTVNKDRDEPVDISTIECNRIAQVFDDDWCANCRCIATGQYFGIYYRSSEKSVFVFPLKTPPIKVHYEYPIYTKLINENKEDTQNE